MRRISSSLFIALAVLVGQYAAAIHALSHATEQLSRKDGSTPSQDCPQCPLFAQLSAGADATVPSVVPDDSAAVVSALPVAILASAASFLAFRSRAPPLV